jgi:GT2 family glycosyltransferase
MRGGSSEGESEVSEANTHAQCAVLAHALPRRSTQDTEKAPLALVIVTYNSSAVLEGLLDSIPAGLEGVCAFDVIVCDNDSRDRSADLALAHPIKPRVIRTGRNAGYAAGINAATATISPASHLLILNPDIRLQPGAVRTMLNHMSDPSIGVAAPRNLCADGTVDRIIRREPSVRTAWADGILGGKLAARLGLSEIVDDVELYDSGGFIDWASGSALLVTSEARRTVGAWDESFFLYSEEVDYQRRVRSYGFKIFYVPQAEVVHIGGECHANPSLFALLTINRIRYFARHHGALPTFMFRLGVAAGEMFRAARGATHRAALLSALSPLRESSRAIANARAPS